MMHFKRLRNTILLFSLTIFSCYQKVAATTSQEQNKQTSKEKKKEELVNLIQEKNSQRFEKFIDDNSGKKFFDKQYDDNQMIMHLLAKHDKNGEKTQYVLENAKKAKIKIVINARMKPGKNHPLHIAVENDNLAFVKRMKQYQEEQRKHKSTMTQLKVNTKNKDEKTPLDIANEQKISNKKAIVELLEKMGKPRKRHKKQEHYMSSIPKNSKSHEKPTPSDLNDKTTRLKNPSPISKSHNNVTTTERTSNESYHSLTPEKQKHQKQMLDRKSSIDSTGTQISYMNRGPNKTPSNLHETTPVTPLNPHHTPMSMDKEITDTTDTPVSVEIQSMPTMKSNTTSTNSIQTPIPESPTLATPKKTNPEDHFFEKPMNILLVAALTYICYHLLGRLFRGYH